VQALYQERQALRAAQAPALTILWGYPVPYAAPHTVMRRPLLQAMVLLWSVSVARLGWRFFGDVTITWAIAAHLNALLAGLLTGTLQRAWLLPIALLQGCGATIITVGLSGGVSTGAGLSVIGVAYALLVWRLGVMLLQHPVVQRLAQVAHLHGDRLQLERLLHATACSITLLNIACLLLVYGVWIPHSAYLLALGLSVLFWALTGQYYDRPWQRYLALESTMFGAVLVYSWLVYVPFASSPLLFSGLDGFLRAPGLGFTCVLLSIGLYLVRRMLQHWPVVSAATMPQPYAVWRTELHQYEEPLHVVMRQMALLAALLAYRIVLPSLTGIAYTAGFAPLAVLGCAGGSLLLVNHGRRPAWLSLLGLGCVLLAALGSQSLAWHGTPVTAFWFGVPGYTEQWLTLAILAGGLASLAQYARQHTGWLQSYPPILAWAAWGTYGWALLGALTLWALLPWQPARAIAWVFLALAAALLPLLRPLSAATTLRGGRRSVAAQCWGHQCPGGYRLACHAACAAAGLGLCPVSQWHLAATALERALAALGHGPAVLALAWAGAGE